MGEVVAFDPKRVSPSRIGTYSDCGQAFKFKYIDGLKAERTGSAALFGKVMHRAREDWVLDRSLDLIDLTEKAWKLETQHDPVIGTFLDRYRRLSRKAIRQEQEIRAARPEIKAVRMTRDWKQSDIAKQIESLMREWLPALNEKSQYSFSERDPLPALYDESLVLAHKYSEENKHLPASYETEFPFEFEWNGYTLNGFIDDICPLRDETGKQFGIGVVDAKTYKQEPKHGAKDWRQLTVYSLAVQHYWNAGVLDIPLDEFPLYQGVDRMRLLDWRWYQMGDAEERRLLTELRMFERGIAAEVFLPASKTCNADFCDFKNACVFWHGNASKEVELNVA